MVPAVTEPSIGQAEEEDECSWEGRSQMETKRQAACATRGSVSMALGAVFSRVKNVCQQNGLLILSVLAVVIGCLLGFFLRSKHLSEQEVKYFQFPGELLMRMLKMLILPLVVSR
ncbi:hypothetical protein DNTS_017917 [Danionella cerebrum]|uniref:Uncharacterized protein n=1 Tax=Danionella cerebrum TaxID=2873325 RepID=A0A553MSB8_9TELE|nr:hypothetical protein DNTS_017917 [Danionella translucida]